MRHFNMHVYSAAEIRKWDAFTIAHEPISSIDLMERAATSLADFFCSLFPVERPVCCVCGQGNNGGDGLALSRILSSKGYNVSAVVLATEKATADFTFNLNRLHSLAIPVSFIETVAEMSGIKPDTIIVDAIFGTGLSRMPEGLFAAAIQWINQCNNIVFSVDVPSGLVTDDFTAHNAVVCADYTGTFQCPKLAFFMPENENYVGMWQVLDIGLHPNFPAQFPEIYYWVDKLPKFINPIKYSRHSHKGSRGHALIGAGSISMMGAAVLCVKAALRSGAGLVTVATEDAGWPVIQAAAPEAICAAKGALSNEIFQLQRRVKAIGVGPGWLPDNEHLQLLTFLIEKTNLPLVVDATALGLLSEMMQVMPTAGLHHAIVLTPHIGEFDRLFGPSLNQFERMYKAIAAAKKYQVTILLKGAYSQVITPEGKVYFNSTGNNGMAKGGSGDVLTGLLTGLLAQQYPAAEACILANYLHGYAGNLAAEKYTTAGMTAINIIEMLPEAWRQLKEHL